MGVQEIRKVVTYFVQRVPWFRWLNPNIFLFNILKVIHLQWKIEITKNFDVYMACVHFLGVTEQLLI